MTPIKKIFKNNTLSGMPFRPCITDGSWFIMRWDIISPDTKNCATYIFGADGIDLTLYSQRHKDFPVEDLTLDTVKQHIENNDVGTGWHRFEFNGEQFEYCDKEPRWAEYDCGIIEERKYEN